MTDDKKTGRPIDRLNALELERLDELGKRLSDLRALKIYLDEITGERVTIPRGEWDRLYEAIVAVTHLGEGVEASRILEAWLDKNPAPEGDISILWKGVPLSQYSRADLEAIILDLFRAPIRTRETPGNLVKFEGEELPF